MCGCHDTISLFHDTISLFLHRFSAGSKWKMLKGGEREVVALQAEEAARMVANNTPAESH